MRVLFTSTPAYGHLQPMLPLAQALRRAGHDVLVAVAPELCGRVERAGLAATPAGLDFGGWWPELQRRNPGEPWSRLRPDEILGWFMPHLFAEVGAAAMLDGVVAAVERWRPDVVVRETYEFAAPLAAAAASIPAVHHTLSPLPEAEVFEGVAKAMTPLWRERGLDGSPLKAMRRERCLDICPPSLRNPRALPLTAEPLRPAAASLDGEAMPAWFEALAQRPVVHVTFGTSVTNADQALLGLAVSGLREEDLSVVVTVGPNNDPAALGEQPANVRVERYLPHGLLLPRCAAVVSHGGAGTMLAALGCGLPILTIPQGADQYLNAELCARRGVGRTLLSADVTAQSVRREVRALLDDPAHGRAAREVAAEIAAMPGTKSAVSLLERLAGFGTGSAA